jgi:hypothetical protein
VLASPGIPATAMTRLPGGPMNRYESAPYTPLPPRGGAKPPRPLPCCAAAGAANAVARPAASSSLRRFATIASRTGSCRLAAVSRTVVSAIVSEQNAFGIALDPQVGTTVTDADTHAPTAGSRWLSSRSGSVPSACVSRDMVRVRPCFRAHTADLVQAEMHRRPPPGSRRVDAANQRGVPISPRRDRRSRGMSCGKSWSAHVKSPRARADE